jgi:hypothetical protein
MMSDTLVTQGFNYSALSTGDAATARAAAGRIRDRHKRQIAGIIETGHDLLEMKELLGHGQFLKWLHAEFAWAERTARNYMSAAQQFADKSAFIADLPPNEVYRLASPSTPSSVRDAVLERLEAGELVGSHEVREMVRDAKEDVRRVKAKEQMSPRPRKTRAQKRDEEERARQEGMRRHEEADQAAAELAHFIAGQLGAALPDVIRQIEVARSKGAYLRKVIDLLADTHIAVAAVDAELETEFKEV